MNCLKHEEEYKEEVKKAKLKDVKRNAKRKGIAGFGNSKRIAGRRRVSGFRKRKPDYVWLDKQVLSWLKKVRAAKFIVTPNMIKNFGDVLFQKEKGFALAKLDYWYRSFRERHKVVIRRVTSLRRKKYTPEELRKIDIQWRGFIRKWKLKRNYQPDLILNMDEVPLYMDMFTGWTLAFQGEKHVEGNFTNSDKLRFTGVCAVSGTGKKLPVSAIFRLLKSGNWPGDIHPDNFDHAVEYYGAAGGSMTSEVMIWWIQDILVPYLEEHGGGSDGLPALLMFDPAKPHLTSEVREKLKENNVDVAVMPASTTHKYQMIDVVVAKPFKNSLYNSWAKWMVEVCSELDPATSANNFRHPTRPDVLDWVKVAWENIKGSSVVKKAKDLLMTADPGAPVESYEDEDAPVEENADEREF